MVEYSIYVQFNEINNKFANTHSNDLQQIQIYPDPTFEDAQIFSDKTPIILIKGENLLRGVKESDYRVWVGYNGECNITSITMSLIACLLPDQNNMKAQIILNESKAGYRSRREAKPSNSYEVKIQIGQTFMRSIGFLKYEKETGSKYDMVEVKYIIVAACLVGFVLLSTMTGCFVILKRRQNKQIRQLKRMQTEFENLEMRVARECKEAFTELQMDIGELANTLNQTGAPFNDYQTYCMKILFPNASETEKYYLPTSIDLRVSLLIYFLDYCAAVYKITKFSEIYFNLRK